MVGGPAAHFVWGSWKGQAGSDPSATDGGRMHSRKDALTCTYSAYTQTLLCSPHIAANIRAQHLGNEAAADRQLLVLDPALWKERPELMDITAVIFGRVFACAACCVSVNAVRTEEATLAAGRPFVQGLPASRRVFVLQDLASTFFSSLGGKLAGLIYRNQDECPPHPLCLQALMSACVSV